MEIRSVSEFLDAINSEDNIFYRGQADYLWGLEPSISRINKPDFCYDMLLRNWKGVEDYLIREFKNFSVPYLTTEPKNEFDWLIHAQHHGLPTRLLDLTTNPLKALFFAIENRDAWAQDGSVYMMSPKSISPNTENIHLGNQIQFLRSAHINERIAAQEGAFLLYPLDKSSLDKFGDVKNIYVNNLTKLKIPSERKPIFERELNKLGINHRTIYPGLDGISKTLKAGFK